MISTCIFLKNNIQASEALKTEVDDLKKRHDEAASKVLQLEEDIMTVTQKAIAKETELDRYLVILFLTFIILLFLSIGAFFKLTIFNVCIGFLY